MGFITQGSPMLPSESSFILTDNRAHSSQIGLLLTPNQEPLEGESGFMLNSFFAFKCTNHGVLSYFYGLNIGIQDVYTAESANGVLLMLWGGTSDQDRSIFIRDSVIVGEVLEDVKCPLCFDGYESYGNCGEVRSGLRLGSATEFGLSYPVVEYPEEEVCVEEVGGNSFIGVDVVIENTRFVNFYPREDSCGIAEYAIVTNLELADYTPIHTFSDVTFENVDQTAFIFLESPLEEWLIDQKCGEETCTGLLNILLIFENTQITYTSTSLTPIFASETASFFQLISANPSLTPYLACSAFPSSISNAYYCDSSTTPLAHLLITDLDSNPFDIASLVRKDGFSQSLNSNQISTLSSLPPKYISLLETNTQEYTLEFTYNTPLNLELSLHLPSPPQSTHTTLKILFKRTLSVRVLKDNNYKEGELGFSQNFIGTECGDNMWNVDEHSLQVYFDADAGSDGQGCVLVLESGSAVKLSVRLDVTLEDYLGQDGLSLFVDRIAETLGIHVSRIRIVGVRLGSVRVDCFIEQSDDAALSEEEKSEELEEVLGNLEKALAEGALDFGYPVLDYEMEYVDIHHVKEEETAESMTTEIELLTFDEEESDYLFLIIIAAGSVIVFIIGVICFVRWIKKRKKAKMSKDQGHNIVPLETAKTDCSKPSSPSYANTQRRSVIKTFKVIKMRGSFSPFSQNAPIIPIVSSPENSPKMRRGKTLYQEYNKNKAKFASSTTKRSLLRAATLATNEGKEENTTNTLATIADPNKKACGENEPQIQELNSSFFKPPQKNPKK